MTDTPGPTSGDLHSMLTATSHVCRVVKVGWHAKCRVKRLCVMSGQLRVGVEELRWYGRGTCVRSARATAEAKVKAWLARQAHSGITAEAEHADDVDGGEFPGEVVGLVLEFSPHNEEQAWGTPP